MSAIHVYLIALIIFIYACKTPSKPTFLASTNDRRISVGWLMNKRFLIHHVHSGYRVRLKTEACIAKELAEKAVRGALLAWVQALEKAQQLHLLQTDRRFSKSIAFVDDDEDLVVNMVCSLGVTRTSSSAFHNPHVLFTLTLREVFWTENQTGHVRRGAKDKGAYFVPLLVHELGHTFGLADTYLYPGRENRSTGGSAHTIAKQPLSIMAAAYAVTPHDANSFVIQSDDIAGMAWLYNYFVAETLSESHHCVLGYVYEEESAGCLPKEGLMGGHRELPQQ